MTITPTPGKPRTLRSAGWILWALVLCAGVALWLLRPERQAPTAASPPVLAAIPAFQLVDDRGQPFGSEQLRGRVYVADFIFTRCQSLCPIITRRMHQLQQRLDAEGLDASLISVSVDPEYDTPERLKVYAEQAGADPRRWRFLTGPLDDVYALVVDGFGTAIERGVEHGAATGAPTSAPASAPANVNDMVDISHTSRFFVVDGQGQLRALVDSDAAGVATAVLHVRALLAETPAAAAPAGATTGAARGS